MPYRSATTCPLPHTSTDCVLLAHGEGARLTRKLVREVFQAAFENPFLHPLADGAVLPAVQGRLVMTTDSFVVSPLFFPGGDIGSLAVHGSINDLAACGAEPLYLSLSFILEEGFALEELRQIVHSIREAANACGVHIVTGDTKVVPRGAADGLFINTTGLGRLPPGRDVGTQGIRAGDRILVSGTIGDHGITILTAREGLEFDSPLRSDTAPLHGLVADLFNAGIDVRFLRDATRGGVSAVLQEVTEATGLTAVLDETLLPVVESVRATCELLGLDPLYVANEGKLIAIVGADEAGRALTSMRRHPLGRNAANIGYLSDETSPQVLVRGSLGALRVLDDPSGAPLPRIC